MQHMLFEDVGGQPFPRTRRAQGGEVRSADGVVFFSLDQAVERFKVPREKLVELWNDSFADLPWAQSPVVEAGAAADPAPENAHGTPSVGLSAAPPRDDRPLAVLRRVVGGHLTDDQWDYYLELCRRLGFDPWCQHVIPRVETDERTGEEKVSIITRVSAMVLRAQRSGAYEGQTAPQWCGRDLEWKDGWVNDDEPPFMARVGVLRRGFREPIWGVVHWRDRVVMRPVADPAAENGIRYDLDPFWRDQGCHMLAKCARADAFRNAFAEELAGVYAFEEMSRADARPEPGRGAPIGLAQPGSSMDPIEIPAGRPEQVVERINDFDADAIPATDEQFDAALRALGFDSPDVRRRVIRRFHVDLERLFDVNPQAAYSKAMDLVRQNPEHFGATRRRRAAYSPN